MKPVLATNDTKGPDAAYNLLNSSLSQSKQTELLYTLELGELLRQNRQYEKSNQMWFLADAQIHAWEQTTITNPYKLLSYLGASTVNERMKPYEGQDYEKTWLSTRIAMNHLSMNDWDKARVAIKRTHEREAIIAAFRAKELAAVQQEAAGHGWSTKNKTLSDYPVAYIESSDVLTLHNSYQNTFSHYLAGFVYEALNEPSLAAPGYRKAIELNPKATVLQEGLRGMEGRMRYSNSNNAGLTDVLFIVESGDAPARVPFEVNLPFFYKDKDQNTQVLYIPIAFPVVKPTPAPHPVAINLEGVSNTLQATAVMDLNPMARRALLDEMPGLIIRGFTRAASKGALQYYTTEEDAIFGLIASIFSIVTEHADDRIWRTLPGGVLLVREYIAPGGYPLIINGSNSGKTINIQGKYAVVPIRISGRFMLVGDVSSYGVLSSTAPTTTPAPYTPPDTYRLEANTTIAPEIKPRTETEQKPRRHGLRSTSLAEIEGN